jgi:hypothetical protein
MFEYTVSSIKSPLPPATLKIKSLSELRPIAGAGPATWAEAIRLVPHLDDFDRDFGWVVARHTPAAIAHVTG